MNCEEFRSQIAEGKHLAGTVAIEHLETCAECRAMAHAEQELRQCLVAFREAAPEISAALDGAVIAAYRQKVAPAPSASGRARVAKPLLWAAVAASLILAAVLVLAYRKPAPPMKTKSAPAQPTVIDAKPAVQAETAGPASPKVSGMARPAIRAAHARRSPRRRQPVSVAAVAAPSSGFQNLMFCDPLSCPGPMQVIRIQVPAAAMDRVPAWRPASGMVRADVVVGSDGIARAIRIVR